MLKGRGSLLYAVAAIGTVAAVLLVASVVEGTTPQAILASATGGVGEVPSATHPGLCCPAAYPCLPDQNASAVSPYFCCWCYCYRGDTRAVAMPSVAPCTLSDNGSLCWQCPPPCYKYCPMGSSAGP